MDSQAGLLGWPFSGMDPHEVPQEILGPDFDGYLIVDGFSAYTVLEYAKGQCNAHLLRRSKELADNAAGQDKPCLDELVALLQDAIGLAERREQLTNEGYARGVRAIEKRLDDWLLRVSRRRDPSLELTRLANHVVKHYDIDHNRQIYKISNYFLKSVLIGDIYKDLIAITGILGVTFGLVGRVMNLDARESDAPQGVMGRSP